MVSSLIRGLSLTRGSQPAIPIRWIILELSKPNSVQVDAWTEGVFGVDAWVEGGIWGWGSNLGSHAHWQDRETACTLVGWAYVPRKLTRINAGHGDMEMVGAWMLQKNLRTEAQSQKDHTAPVS